MITSELDDPTGTRAAGMVQSNGEEAKHAHTMQASSHRYLGGPSGRALMGQGARLAAGADQQQAYPQVPQRLPLNQQHPQVALNLQQHTIVKQDQPETKPVSPPYTNVNVSSQYMVAHAQSANMKAHSGPATTLGLHQGPAHVQSAKIKSHSGETALELHQGPAHGSAHVTVVSSAPVEPACFSTYMQPQAIPQEMSRGPAPRPPASPEPGWPGSKIPPLSSRAAGVPVPRGNTLPRKAESQGPPMKQRIAALPKHVSDPSYAPVPAPLASKSAGPSNLPTTPLPSLGSTRALAASAPITVMGSASKAVAQPPSGTPQASIAAPQASAAAHQDSSAAHLAIAAARQVLAAAHLVTVFPAQASTSAPSLVKSEELPSASASPPPARGPPTEGLSNSSSVPVKIGPAAAAAIPAAPPGPKLDLGDVPAATGGLGQAMQPAQSYFDDPYKKQGVRSFARHCPRCMGRIRRSQKDAGGPSGGGCVNQTCQKCCFHINIRCEYHGYGMGLLGVPAASTSVPGPSLAAPALTSNDSRVEQALQGHEGLPMSPGVSQSVQRAQPPSPRPTSQQPGVRARKKVQEHKCQNPECGVSIAKTVPLFCPRSFCASCCRSIPGVCKYRGHVYIPIGQTLQNVLSSGPPDHQAGSSAPATCGCAVATTAASPSSGRTEVIMQLRVQSHVSLQLSIQSGSLVAVHMDILERVAVSLHPISPHTAHALSKGFPGRRPGVSSVRCHNTECAIPISKAAATQCFLGMCKGCCTKARGQRSCSYIGHSYVSKREQSIGRQGLTGAGSVGRLPVIEPKEQRTPRPCSSLECQNMVAFWAHRYCSHQMCKHCCAKTCTTEPCRYPGHAVPGRFAAAPPSYVNALEGAGSMHEGTGRRSHRLIQAQKTNFLLSPHRHHKHNHEESSSDSDDDFVGPEYQADIPTEVLPLPSMEDDPLFDFLGEVGPNEAEAVLLLEGRELEGARALPLDAICDGETEDEQSISGLGSGSGGSNKQQGSDVPGSTPEKDSDEDENSSPARGSQSTRGRQGSYNSPRGGGRWGKRARAIEAAAVGAVTALGIPGPPGVQPGLQPGVKLHWKRRKKLEQLASRPHQLFIGKSSSMSHRLTATFNGDTSTGTQDWVSHSAGTYFLTEGPISLLDHALEASGHMPNSEEVQVHLRHRVSVKLSHSASVDNLGAKEEGSSEAPSHQPPCSGVSLTLSFVESRCHMLGRDSLRTSLEGLWSVPTSDLPDDLIAIDGRRRKRMQTGSYVDGGGVAKRQKKAGGAVGADGVNKPRGRPPGTRPPGKPPGRPGRPPGRPPGKPGRPPGRPPKNASSSANPSQAAASLLGASEDGRRRRAGLASASLPGSGNPFACHNSECGKPLSKTAYRDCRRHLCKACCRKVSTTKCSYVGHQYVSKNEPPLPTPLEGAAKSGPGRKPKKPESGEAAAVRATALGGEKREQGAASAILKKEEELAGAAVAEDKTGVDASDQELLDAEASDSLGSYGNDAAADSADDDEAEEGDTDDDDDDNDDDDDDNDEEVGDEDEDEDEEDEDEDYQQHQEPLAWPTGQRQDRRYSVQLPAVPTRDPRRRESGGVSEVEQSALRALAKLVDSQVQQKGTATLVPSSKPHSAQDGHTSNGVSKSVDMPEGWAAAEVGLERRLDLDGKKRSFSTMAQDDCAGDAFDTQATKRPAKEED